MPLSLTVSCFSKIQIGFTFLVPAHPGCPRKRAVKRVCVCVYLVSWLHNIKFKIVNFLRNYIKNVFLKHSDTGQLTQKLKDKKNWYIHLAVARTEVQHQVGLQGAMCMTQDQLPAENQAKCISQHLQLRTGGFCWCKVLLPACPC